MSRKHSQISWDTPQRQVFGAQIREARVTRFASQESFAKALQVAPPYISQIESGRRIPSDELLCDMAKLLSEAADWGVVRIEAHRLRSPYDLAALVVAQPDSTPGISNDQLFQRLRIQLEHSELPPERRARMIEGWLEEIQLVKQRLEDDSSRRLRRVERGLSR